MAPEFIMSRHACTRAVDMGLEADEITDAFNRPLNSNFSMKTGSWYLTRHRITLVLSDEPIPTVKTILWARAADTAADMNLPALKGREVPHLAETREVQRLRKRSR